MRKRPVFECCACDPEKPCVAIGNDILDKRTPTECPFNDTPEWIEV